MFKNQIQNPANFKDWLFVYSHGKNSNYDDKDADGAFDLMKASSKIFGIKFQDPGFLTINQGNNANNWKK